MRCLVISTSVLFIAVQVQPSAIVAIATIPPVHSEMEESRAKDSSPVISRVRDGSALTRYLPSLQRLLQRCVNDDPAGSSIGFLAPLSDEVAIKHWLDLQPSITGDSAENTLLIATLEDDTVIATVLIARALKQTHIYKGEVRKLLVHPDFRRHGLGRTMMTAVERTAREDLGLELLLLDTATAFPARLLYLKTGWTEWGICPDYAMDAAGSKHECSFFFKRL
ncbi:acyl-CoA N-acyltransferase [Nemania sp. NC0429]|nr:acyl-CoA N-acyltransferase [Nemania sp. NC0429]